MVSGVVAFYDCYLANCDSHSLRISGSGKQAAVLWFVE
jgi:hypothetical protein